MSIITSYSTSPDSQANAQKQSQQSSRSAGYDPVDKLRISTPQALIDTDFEYGTQPTKWESIALQQNRQSCYYTAQSPLAVTVVQGDGTTRAVVVTTTSSLPSVGGLVYVQNTLDTNANGWYYVTATGAGTFTYQASGIVGNANQYNPANTYIYLGFFYSSCGIVVATGSGAAFTASSTTVTGTTTYPHGLSVGSFIYVVGTTAATNNPPNGAWVVTTVPTATTFTFSVINAPTGAITATAGAGVTLYARPSGYVEPRAFDGGVAFSAGATVPNQQLIRQTRRYFRYQSGKGIQFSTGTSLKPAIFTTSLTATNFTVTVNTRFPHNLTAGSSIIVANANEPAYNGTFTIASVPSVTSLTYISNAPPPATATGLAIKITPTMWYGSTNRIGMFDQQNGLFFEYDGQTTYAVMRNSVNQISGTVQVTQGNATVTGTGTQFSTQLACGDFIVIRGQSYRVITITSDTQLFISPEYRGASISNGGYLVSKTIDFKIPQSQWFDVCDGSNSLQNPSGYNLDLTRMQMFYIDYSWYGAGVARFGFRGVGGAVTYVYSFVNNNQKYEAYMRSGNMCAHYESNGITPTSFLTQTLGSSDTTIYVSDTSLFAPSGSIKVQGSGTSGNIEYMTYTGKTARTLTGLTRATTGGQASAQTFTYSATAPISIDYASPDTASALSHWGSSVIMDGRFDDDKSLLFNYGMLTPLTTTTLGQVTPLMAIRLAPSVDNGTTGTLGQKETINRAQLQLSELGLYTTGTGYFIQLYLNGYPSAAFGGSASGFASPIAPTSSLAQVALNTTLGTTIIGGESVAAAYTNATGQTTLDLTQVRDLGNAILGGGISNTVPTSQAGVYPDGPDILYVVATALTATSSTIVARLTWKEAQA
jgi:hypothetical protein